MLNSGMFALVFGSYVIYKLGTEQYVLIICLSTLSGLGGSAIIDFAFGLIRLWARNTYGNGNGNGNGNAKRGR